MVPNLTNMLCLKTQVEKEKQDDALSDLSNILGDLKSMAVDMGSELDRSYMPSSFLNLNNVVV